MAITITVAAAKKLPHPTQQFGSIQGTVSLQGEAGNLNEVAAVVRDLFAAAQSSVDQHLAEQAVAPPQAAAQPQPVKPVAAPIQAQPRQGISQPYRSNGQRRSPAPVTDSQLRFLKRLIDQTKAAVPAILDQYRVGSLDQLSCRDAAGLIDELKGQVAA
jgi:hypothetical protein